MKVNEIEEDTAMAKRGGFPGMGMPGNMNNLMKQAQKMQRQMEENQKALETLSVQEAEELMAEGQFEAATMLPKIEAALDFVTHGNHRKAVITSLEKAQDSMAKKAGTVIQ